VEVNGGWGYSYRANYVDFAYFKIGTHWAKVWFAPCYCCAAHWLREGKVTWVLIVHVAQSMVFVICSRFAPDE
jgi:hypothetical protein